MDIWISSNLNRFCSFLLVAILPLIPLVCSLFSSILFTAGAIKTREEFRNSSQVDTITFTHRNSGQLFWFTDKAAPLIKKGPRWQWTTPPTHTHAYLGQLYNGERVLSQGSFFWKMKSKMNKQKWGQLGSNPNLLSLSLLSPNAWQEAAQRKGLQYWRGLRMPVLLQCRSGASLGKSSWGAEETPELLTLGSEKPKGRVKSRDNKGINLKVVGTDGVVQFKMKGIYHLVNHWKLAVNDRLGQGGRSESDPMGSQSQNRHRGKDGNGGRRTPVAGGWRCNSTLQPTGGVY